MKSKTSFFNKMIFWKDITRFWPLWTLQLMIGFFGIIAPSLSQLSYFESSDAGNKEKLDYMSGIIQGSCLSPYIMGMCIIIAISVFLYLTREREAYTIHSFPLKRTQIFTSHYLAGLVMLVLPVLAVQVVLVLIVMAHGISGIISLIGIYILEWMIQIFFFYSLACAVVMLTGNAFMSLVIYGVLNFLVVGVAMLYSMLADLFVYGNQGFSMSALVDNRIIKVFTPVIFFLTHSFHRDGYGLYGVEECETYLDFSQYMTDIAKTAVYLIPAVLLVVLAVSLYRIRQLEAAGDMIAFPWGRPVFRIVFVFCSSLIFAAAIYAICFGNIVSNYAYGKIFRIVLMLVIIGTVIFYLIGNMILDKTFFIWKRTSYWRMALFVVLMVLGLLEVRNGQMGSHLPDKSRVQRASITLEYDGDSGNVYESPVFYLTGRKNIDQVFKLNKEILKYGRNMEGELDASSGQNSIQIRYYLSGGKRRAFYYPVESKAEVLKKTKEFLGAQPDVCEMLFGKEYETKLQKNMSITAAYVDDGTLEDGSYSVGLQEEDMQELNEQSTDGQEIRNELYHAVLKDIQEGKCDVFRQKEVNSFEIGLTGENGVEVNQSIQITEKCTNTLKVLEKLDCVKYSGNQWKMAQGIVGQKN